MTEEEIGGPMFGKKFNFDTRAFRVHCVKKSLQLMQ